MNDIKSLTMLAVDDRFIDEADPERAVPKPQLFGGKRFTIIAAVAASVCVITAGLLLGFLLPRNDGNTQNKPDGGITTPPDTGITTPPDIGTTNPPDIGTTNPPDKWSHGFTLSSGEPIPAEHCAYKLTTDTFDIDDVSVEFYFGGFFGGYMWNATEEDIQYKRENGLNIPEFDIYIGNTYTDMLSLVRHSAENFVSVEYKAGMTTDENAYLVSIWFNHSETVPIPKEIFTETSGAFSICIAGTNINDIEPEYKLITAVCISYDVVDGKIVLSKWDGRRGSEKR